MGKGEPSLLWVCSSHLAAKLDRATWLETAAELCNLGWAVTLVTPSVPRRELDDRVSVLSLPRPSLYLVGYLLFHVLLVMQVILGRKADVILFEPEVAPFVIPIRLMRWLRHSGTPLLVMDWRTLPMSTATTREKLRAWFLAAVRRWASLWVDGQTAITPHMAEELCISSEQLLGTWPSGVNSEQFEGVASAREWPGPEDGLHLIYVGALHAERNLLALCQATLLAKAEGLALTLDLVGEGSDKAALEECARKHEGGTIRVRSAVPRCDVPALLAMAHVGVLPFPDLPKFRVSSPIKLFEYMAAAMPVLATRVVCHTDVCGKEDFVFWADDGSPDALVAAIREACAHKARLCRMGRLALAASKTWTWRAAAKQLDASLRRGLGSASGYRGVADRARHRAQAGDVH